MWMFTVPSLRARDCSAAEKDALNILFLLMCAPIHRAFVMTQLDYFQFPFNHSELRLSLLRGWKMKTWFSVSPCLVACTARILLVLLLHGAVLVHLLHGAVLVLLLHGSCLYFCSMDPACSSAPCLEPLGVRNSLLFIISSQRTLVKKLQFLSSGHGIAWWGTCVNVSAQLLHSERQRKGGRKVGEITFSTSRRDGACGLPVGQPLAQRITPPSTLAAVQVSKTPSRVKARTVATKNQTE